MAYVDGHVTVVDPATVTSIQPELPAHVSGDLLVVFVFADNTADDASTPAGWTKITSAADTHTMTAYRKVAASSSETIAAVTFASSLNAGAMAICVKDADNTTPIDVFGVTSSTFGADVLPWPRPTTTVDNCLVLLAAVTDGERDVQIQPGPMLIEQGEVEAGVTGYAACWIWQDSAGQIPEIDLWNTRQADNGNRFAIAIRSAAAIRPGYCDLTSPPMTEMAALNENATPGYPPHTKYDPTGTITSIGGKTTYYTVPGLNDPGNGVWPFHVSSRQICNTVNQYGFWGATLGASIDLTGKNVTTNMCLTTGFYFATFGTLAQGGYVFGLGSSATDYRIWKGLAQDTVPTGQFLKPLIIDPADTTNVVESGGAFDITAVDRVFYGVLNNGAHGGGLRYVVSQVHALESVVVIGGSSARPACVEDLRVIAWSASLLTIQNQGGQSALQFVSFQDLQIGNGGADEVYFSDSNFSLEFPVIADESQKLMQFQDAAEDIGILIDAGASDTVHITSATIAGSSPWRFEIDAGSSASADYDFSGLVIINAGIILRPVTTFAGITFSGCKEIDDSALNGADLSGGCTISSGAGTNAISIAGATQAALQAALDDLANCTLLSNNVAIRVNYTGTGDITLNFSNIDWSGNTTDIHYNSTNASALTANMQAGSNATTSAFSGAATGVTIANDVTFTINVSETGAEITLLRTGTTTEEYHVETGGLTQGFTFTAPLGFNVDLQVFKPGFRTFWQSNIDLGAADSSITATLEEAPAYVA